MKFEQAFYTRGTGLLNETRGLGIAAASRLDREFLSNCMTIGSQFGRERSHEPSEFLLYSEIFHSFVAVGIYPSYAEDGGGVNKICHMYIPTEACTSTDAYYLKYDFQKECEKGKQLETVEISPYFDKERDFDRIRETYFAKNEKKLAEFLWKVYSIFFGNKRFVLMVIDGEYEKAEFFDVARELMWFASHLVPNIPEYLQNLSYGVNMGEQNLGCAHFAFVADETLHSNRFYLKKQCKESIPQVYFEIAKRAFCSYTEVEEFLKDLIKNKAQKTLNSENLQWHYLNWKVEQNEEFTWEELDLDENDLKSMKGKSETEREFFYKCFVTLKEIPIECLEQIWKFVIVPVFEMKRPQTENFINLAVHILCTIFKENFDLYKQFLADIQKFQANEICKQLYKQEFDCISKHIDTISNVKESKEVFELYGALHEETKFLEKMQTKVLQKVYYFEMDRETRTYFSKKFEVIVASSWNFEVYTFITEELNQSFELLCTFLEEEKDKVEIRYVARYFKQLFDEKLKFDKLEISNKQETDKRFFAIADIYLKLYEDSVAERKNSDEHKIFKEDIERYKKLKQGWELKNLELEMRKHSLHENLEIDIEGLEQNKEYSEQYINVYRFVWCKGIVYDIEKNLERFEDYLENIEEEIIEKLLFHWGTLERMEQSVRYRMDMGEDAKKDVKQMVSSYKEKVWKLCQNSISNQIKGAVTLEMDFWKELNALQDNLFDKYEEIYLMLKDNSSYQKLEIQSVTGTSEFNRKCYLEWKYVIKQNNNFLHFKWKEILRSDYFMAKQFITKLQAHEALKVGKVYLQLGIVKDELSTFNERSSPIIRYQIYEKMEKENPERFELLFKNISAFVSDSAVLQERIEEVKLYRKISDYLNTENDDLKEMDALLQEAKNIFKYYGTKEKLENIQKLKDRCEEKRRQISSRRASKAPKPIIATVPSEDWKRKYFELEKEYQEKVAELEPYKIQCDRKEKECEEYKPYKEKYETERKNNDILNNENSILRTELEELKRNLSASEAVKTDSNSDVEYRNLLEKNRELEQENSNLKAENSQLKIENKELDEGFKRLMDKCNEIIIQHNELSTKYDELSKNMPKEEKLGNFERKEYFT